VNAYQVLDALGDGTRRAVLERLRSGPKAVHEIADGLPVSRPAVSQHLRVLKEAGLVDDHALGTRRVYRLEPDGLAPARAYLEEFWTHTLERYKREVES
jgi:DNA-binding transcriptional ArsR family regulator